MAPESRRGRKRKRNNVQNATDCNGRNKVVVTRALKLVGRYVQREFKGSGILLGKIVLYGSGSYGINYENGHHESLNCGKVKEILVDDGDLTGEWSEKKEKLDELLLSNDVDVEVLKIENRFDAKDANRVDSSPLSEMIDGDADSSGDSCEDIRGGDVVELELPPVPPLELPPSSGHIGVPEEYVSHLLSVYGFLRSFSVTLFLHPFGLDDFVGALNFPVANTLLDSVHVALMRVLKRHLERLSSDGSELASKCLRCLDWTLLDTLTWPVFLVHYLMLMGYKKEHDWKGFYIHSLERDYYTLSAGQKLIVLQIICEDVLDSEELRTVMDMHEQSEVGTDIDASTMVAAGASEPRIAEHSEIKCSLGSHSTMESQVGSFTDDDGNGDECRLCGMDGLLVCCDGCPSAYHSRCLGLNKMLMPDGSWYCPECKINATEPRVLRGTSLRGGQVLGVDLYEQVFVASCDHLLVLKASINSGDCVRYYSRHDIRGVVRTLHSKVEHVTTYSEICRGINKYWEIPLDILPCNEMPEVGLQLANKEEFGECTTPVKYNGTVNGSYCSYMGSSFKTSGYINYYLHGDFSVSAATNLALLSSEENQVIKSRSSDNKGKVKCASVALQVKAFSSAAVRFFWPNTEKKLVEVPRERCSWCFSCKAHATNKKGCLLNAAASNAIRGAMKVFAGVRTAKNGDGRISGIATYIIFVQESLSGLLVGPFVNDNFRKQWRKEVEQATTCHALKILLLELEENIRSIALSGDWTKLLEGCSTKSCSSQIAASASKSNQKRRPGRRGRKPSTVHEVEVVGRKDMLTDFTWWRGGTVSRLMFQRGNLPYSLVKKSARQGGLKKIPGIHYTEGNEISKISRQLCWRSTVEMSRNTAQLALQVRYLDFHVRWSDLVRLEQNNCDGKTSETEASAFRNACICDKKVVGHEIRYCVAFGNQKHLPSRVMKNIAEIEQMMEGKERYWFSETCIPLYLIKEYEPKMHTNNPVNVLTKLQRRKFKGNNRKNILSYLFCGQHSMVCCSCHQDVFYRNAVKCRVCQEFCHEQCATSTAVNTSEEVEITCKKCCETQNATRVESPKIPLLIPGQDILKPDIPTKGVQLVGHKEPSASVGSLEHSSKVKSINRSAAAKGKGNKSNWGLIWRKKNYEDTGIDFRLRNILMRGNPNINLKNPLCRLCNQPYNADLMYVHCETCQYWFHADALELDESKIFTLVGFKCCRCRKVKSPVCPYLDPEKKKVLEGKMEIQQSAKQEISATEFDSGIFSEVNNGGNNATVSSPAPQKLPLRRHINQENKNAPFEAKNVFNSSEKFSEIEVRSPSKANGVSCMPDLFSSQAQPIASKENSDDNMELGTQTYFSLDELLEFEYDGSHANDRESPENVVIENCKSSSIPAENEALEKTRNQEEPITSVEKATKIVKCKICSSTEPCPDLSCRICYISIHSRCSPWFESSSWEDGWKCGSCREWR
ncbi:hypothetical protein ABFX02_14G240300 [Erythranthe guttata]